MYCSSSTDDLSGSDEVLRNVLHLRKRIQRNASNLNSLTVLDNVETRMDRAENIAPHCTETVPAELTLHDLNPQQYQHRSIPQSMLPQHCGLQQPLPHADAGNILHSAHRNPPGGALNSHSSQQQTAPNRPGSANSMSSLPLGAAYNNFLQPKLHTLNNHPVTTPSTHAHSSLPTGMHTVHTAKSGTLSMTPMISNSVPGVLDYENDMLKKRMHLLREENSQLMEQNAQLLAQLENVGFQMHQANTKVREYEAEVCRYKEQFTEFEERTQRLEIETETQSISLKEYDDRAEAFKRQIVTLQDSSKSLKEQLRTQKNDLYHETAISKQMKDERDTAMQNVGELESMLTECQRKAKDRIRKLLASEENLRDNLLHADRERDELLQATHTLQEQVCELQEEIRHCHEDSLEDREVKEDLHEDNQDLKSNLTNLRKKIVLLENNLSERADVMEENDNLKQTCDELKAKLDRCQVELSQSNDRMKTMQQQLNIQLNDSKNSKNSIQTDSGIGLLKPVSVNIHSSQETTLNASFTDLINTPDQKINVSELKTMLTELRLRIAERDHEVQQLHVELDKHCVGSTANVAGQQNVVENMKQQLQVTLDTAREAEDRVAELETELAETQRKHRQALSRQSVNEDKMANADNELVTMETKLTDINDTMSELQQQLSDRSEHISALEREGRKKSSQLTCLERQLDDKVLEVADLVSKVNDLEQELEVKVCDLKLMTNENSDRDHQIAEHQAMTSKLKQLHSEQCTELEQQIQLLENKNDNTEDCVTQIHQELGFMKQDILDKEDTIQQIVKERDSLRSQLDSVMQGLQQRTVEGTDKVKQLEASLLMCTEEMKVCLCKMEDMKSEHEVQMEEKLKKITSLELDLSSANEALNERVHTLTDQTAALDDRQHMLQHSNTRISELEDMQLILDKQVAGLEQALEKEKGIWQEESDSYQRQLSHAHLELKERIEQISHMSDTIKELTEGKRQLTDDLSNLEHQIQQYQKDLDLKSTALAKSQVEAQTQRMARKSAQQQLKDRGSELDKLKIKVDDLDSEIRSTQGKLQRKESVVKNLEAELSEVKHEFESSQQQLHERTEQFDSLQHSLSLSQEELRSRNRNVEELEQVLKERQWELQQRAAQVMQLDIALTEHRSELEQKIIHMEGALKKAQLETQQKSKLLSDTEDRVHVCERDIQSKELHIHELEQHRRCMQIEMEQKKAYNKQLEQEVLIVKEQCHELNEKNLGLTQEQRATSEDNQKQHLELLELKRELSISDREQDRLTRELDLLINTTQQKEADVTSLSEQLGVLKAKHLQGESHANIEIRRLQRELETGQYKHTQQLDKLKLQIRHEKGSSDSMEDMIESKQREWLQLEEELRDQINQSQHSIERLQAQLDASQSVISESNQTIVSKESDIARLEAKLAAATSANSTMYSDKTESNVDKHPDFSLSLTRSVLSDDNLDSTTAQGAMSCHAYSVSADSLQSHDHLSYTDTAHGGDIDDSDVTTFSELSATELAHLPVVEQSYSCNRTSRKQLPLRPPDFRQRTAHTPSDTNSESLVGMLNEINISDKIAAAALKGEIHSSNSSMESEKHVGKTGKSSSSDKHSAQHARDSLRLALNNLNKLTTQSSKTSKEGAKGSGIPANQTVRTKATTKITVNDGKQDVKKKTGDSSLNNSNNSGAFSRQHKSIPRMTKQDHVTVGHAQVNSKTTSTSMRTTNVSKMKSKSNTIECGVTRYGAKSSTQNIVTRAGRTGKSTVKTLDSFDSTHESTQERAFCYKQSPTLVDLTLPYDVESISTIHSVSSSADHVDSAAVDDVAVDGGRETASTDGHPLLLSVSSTSLEGGNLMMTAAQHVDKCGDSELDELLLLPSSGDATISSALQEVSSNLDGILHEQQQD